MKIECYLILIIVFLSSPQLKSQELLKNGNQWTYFTLIWPSGELKEVNYKVNGDTLINNLSYKKIYSSSESTNQSYQIEKYVVRQDSEGKTFRLDDNSIEVLLIDNKLEKGDSIMAQENCTFILDKIDSIQILNKWNKEFIYSYNITDPLNNNIIYSSINGFQWLENIGNLRLPFYGPQDYCEAIQNDSTLTSLACFFSSGELIYGEEDICSDVIINTNLLQNDLIDIYPVPFQEEFRIVVEGTNEIKRIVISDLNSRSLIIEDNLSTKMLLVNDLDLPKSVLFITITLSNGVILTRKIIKI